VGGADIEWAKDGLSLLPRRESCLLFRVGVEGGLIHDVRYATPSREQVQYMTFVRKKDRLRCSSAVLSYTVLYCTITCPLPFPLPTLARLHLLSCPCPVLPCLLTTRADRLTPYLWPISFHPITSPSVDPARPSNRNTSAHRRHDTGAP